MTLKEEVARRRAVESDGGNPPPLHATKEHAISLLVEASGGEIWLLPWNHFIFGHQSEADKHEWLVLTFVAHEVMIRGINLGLLVTQVANLGLERLRAVPGKYLNSSEGEPVIEEIQVRPLAKPMVRE